MNNRDKVLGDYYAANFNKLVNRIKRRLDNSVPHAEDVVQETFCRALKYYRDRQENEGNLDAWIGIIMINVLRDYKSEEKRLGATMEYKPEFDEHFEGSQLDQKTLREIRKSIDQKQGLTGEVCRLYFLSGYSIREICEVVDVRYKNAEQIVQRFRNELKVTYGYRQ